MASKKPVVKPAEEKVTEEIQETAETVAEEIEEPIAKAAPVVEKEAPDASFFMYLGPNIPGLIQYGTIYHGTLAEAEAKEAVAIGKYPAIKALLIPGDEIAVRRKEIQKPGTRLYWCYQRVVNGANT